MVASRAHHDDAKSFGAGAGESSNIPSLPLALVILLLFASYCVAITAYFFCSRLTTQTLSNSDTNINRLEISLRWARACTSPIRLLHNCLSAFELF